GAALSWRRRLAGFLITVSGLPLLTWGLHSVRTDESITSDVLAFQLLVVIVALVGGIWPALVAAVAAGMLLNFFFVDPLYTITIANPLHLLALVIFVVVAVLVSFVVDQAARRLRAATRSAAEAEVLVAVAGSVLGGEDAVQALVTRLRESFGMTSVLVRQDGEILASARDPEIADDDDQETTIPLGRHANLYLRGRRLTTSDRRILGAFVSQLATALEQRRLQAEAAGARPLAEADKLRSALLAAVGHDLRRPLASATAAVTSLRSEDVHLDDSDRAELLATADESLEALGTLVTDLLDVSRLQAGVLGVTLDDVELDGSVGGAIDELGLPPGRIALDLQPVRDVRADAVLLQRVIVNLVANALRFAPESAPPLVATSEHGDRVQLRVIDTGPGIPEERREDVFVPFQRLGDTDNSAGVGLGLALSKGFVEAMGGTLEAEDTPGGGLTMVVELAAVELAAVEAAE
uniref:sensor histidine kinase n=1 Tax=Pseudolysinimonas sp. TaxID=2680009 RepID=UPI00286D4749